MGCRHSSLDDENSSLDQQKGKYKTKIDPRILQKYDIQGNLLRSNGTADGLTLIRELGTVIERHFWKNPKSTS